MGDAASFTRLWMQPLELDPAIPSVLVRRASRHFSGRIFADWSCDAPDGGIFRGSGVPDWLVVDFSSAATAGDGLERWNHLFPLSECGFPSKQVASALVPRPRLVISTSEPVSESCRSRLGLDEMHCYSGLADYGSAGGRVYLLLARRGELAWKFFLSLTSDAGTGEELALLRDDHRRASVFFGHLELFGETSSAGG